MPFAAPHSCTVGGCHTLVPRGQARCDTHETERERERGSAAERGYGTAWRKYRLRYLKEHPLCVLCEAEGRTTPATVVDHIKAAKGDQALFWDPTNHRALCETHHNLRTDEGDFGRLPPPPAPGLPTGAPLPAPRAPADEGGG